MKAAAAVQQAMQAELAAKMVKLRVDSDAMEADRVKLEQASVEQQQQVKVSMLVALPSCNLQRSLRMTRAARVGQFYSGY